MDGSTDSTATVSYKMTWTPTYPTARPTYLPTSVPERYTHPCKIYLPVISRVEQLARYLSCSYVVFTDLPCLLPNPIQSIQVPTGSSTQKMGIGYGSIHVRFWVSLSNSDKAR